jgi:hypothetical protein
MARTQTLPARNTYVESRAPLMKSRWERRLGRRLEVQTQRLMPDPTGQGYYADIVLQDPATGLPVVVFEVKSPDKTAEQAESNLRRILKTRHVFKVLGGCQPQAVLLVADSEKDEGSRIKRAVNARAVRVEVV